MSAQIFDIKKDICLFSKCLFDIKKNHAIVAWFSKGLPVRIEKKTPIVYNESMTCQSEIKNTIGGY